MKLLLSLPLLVLIYCTDHHITTEIFFRKVTATAVEFVFGEKNLPHSSNNLSK